MQRRWKKVTPVPPEYNGHGYLYECVKCHYCTKYLGGKKEPPYECPKCREKGETS